jgi:hypothetical protein
VQPHRTASVDDEATAKRVQTAPDSRISVEWTASGDDERGQAGDGDSGGSSVPSWPVPASAFSPAWRCFPQTGHPVSRPTVDSRPCCIRPPPAGLQQHQHRFRYSATAPLPLFSDSPGSHTATAGPTPGLSTSAGFPACCIQGAVHLSTTAGCPPLLCWAGLCRAVLCGAVQTPTPIRRPAIRRRPYAGRPHAGASNADRRRWAGGPYTLDVVVDILGRPSNAATRGGGSALWVLRALPVGRPVTNEQRATSDPVG